MKVSDHTNDRRLSFWIPRELKNRFDDQLPDHGFQGMILREIFRMVVELLEQHGKGVIGLILSRQLKLVIPEGANVAIRRSTTSNEGDESGGASGEDSRSPKISTSPEGDGQIAEEENGGEEDEEA